MYGNYFCPSLIFVSMIKWSNLIPLILSAGNILEKVVESYKHTSLVQFDIN